MKDEERSRALDRLCWLCRETATRIAEEPDDTRFGDVFRLAQEVEELSSGLGLPYPPIQSIRYRRGVTGVASDAPEPPRDWKHLEDSKSPKYLDVDGYRLHDPEDSDAPREFAITATVEGGEKGQHWRADLNPKGEEQRLHVREVMSVATMALHHWLHAQGGEGGARSDV